MKKSLFFVALALCMTGCVTTGSTGGKSASEQANEQAEKAMYKPVEYANSSMPGPELLVLPGEIKSTDAMFPEKVTMDIIADYAELELGKANFKVLDRSDLGPLLQEILAAANLGDQPAVSKCKTGKFKATKWFVKFDIMKAEPVASTQQSFDGRALANIAGAFLGGKGGAAAETGIASAKSNGEVGIWLVGMRYKIMDACSCEQIATGYFEEKMEIGSKSSSFLGVSQAQQGGATLNTMVQRLTQVAVADIDLKWKSWSPPRATSPPPTSIKKRKSTSKKSTDT